jgi:GT2 family glycosyltransferase
VNAVEIVVPIFNAAPQLNALLKSLAQCTPAFARIWLINDASTDVSIAPTLQQFAERAQVSVKILTNEKNLGFVGTVNRAFGAIKGDVVLLNSDTVVTPGWLEAIVRASELNSKIGSITPWSNNAEICSFPNFCQNNAAPNNLATIAHACKTLTPLYPELPTGVGFCMWMSQRALRKIGGFDAATFGRGYGEENDWCLRASGLGFRHILCDNAFVAHTGGSSFAETGEKPGGENMQRLLARYPHYALQIERFILGDSLAPARAQLVFALANVAAHTDAPARMELL